MVENITAFFFHFDDWLRQAAELHPLAFYGLLFAIIFTESAFFPIAPFLPGDGLLLTAGLLLGTGRVHVLPAAAFLMAGAFAGNWVGYHLGRRVGPGIFDRWRWLRREHYEKSQVFYRKYGDWAVVVSRFLPLVRAIVPFVAGVAGMANGPFQRYSLLGVVLWVVSLLTLGYYLDKIPFLDKHLTTLIAAATLLFIVVAVVTIVRSLRRTKGAHA